MGTAFNSKCVGVWVVQFFCGFGFVFLDVIHYVSRLRFNTVTFLQSRGFK